MGSNWLEGDGSAERSAAVVRNWPGWLSQPSTLLWGRATTRSPLGARQLSGARVFSRGLRGVRGPTGNLGEGAGLGKLDHVAALVLRIDLDLLVREVKNAVAKCEAEAQVASVGQELLLRAHGFAELHPLDVLELVVDPRLQQPLRRARTAAYQIVVALFSSGVS